MAYIQSGRRVLLFGPGYLSQFFVGTKLPQIVILVQNVVQTWQIASTIEYNQVTQNTEDVQGVLLGFSS